MTVLAWVQLVALASNLSCLAMAVWTLRRARQHMEEVQGRVSSLSASEETFAEALGLVALVAQQQVPPYAAQQACAAFLARRGITATVRAVSPPSGTVQ